MSSIPLLAAVDAIVSAQPKDILDCGGIDIEISTASTHRAYRWDRVKLSADSLSLRCLTNCGRYINVYPIESIQTISVKMVAGGRVLEWS